MSKYDEIWWRTALAQSYADGKVEGKTEQAVAMAKKMKDDAMPIELIVKYTGLTQSEIESL